jgi:RAD51-like protein 2
MDHAPGDWFQDSYALTSLALAPSTRSKLQRAGVHSARDVLRISGNSPSTLARECALTLDEANDALKAARFNGEGIALRGARSAAELLREERARWSVFTFCEALDDALGGGAASGEITELCGCPGIGKTQMAMQLSVSAQTPRAFGGLGGEAVYVDTEGSFTAERAMDMAEALAEHLGRCAKRCEDEDARREMEAALETCAPEAMLRGIHLFRCHEVTELLAVLETLGEFIAERPKVRLVVIDSVAFHFRQDFQDMALRTTILSKMTNRLMSIATTQQVAVVTVNQVTVKPQRDGSARLVPALGESYAHACTTRVILSWENDERVAFVTKSPRLPQARARYAVTAGGIRDVRGSKRAAP